MSRKVINTYQCDDLEETLAEFINKIPKEHIPYIKLGVMHFESDLYSYTNLPKDFLALDEEVLSVICSYFDDDGEVVSKSELMIDIKNSDVIFLYTPYEIACCVNEEGVDSAVSVINCLTELRKLYNVDALEISVNNDSKSISSKHFASLDF
jgi:hypothetical protein